MNDYAAARHNMVESQIRPNQVSDARLLRAMMDIPREDFVPASLRPLAYMEEEIPVAPPRRGMAQRCLVSPMPLARMIQLAEVEPDDLVLDVGCATGYSTAILARLAESVVGLECDEGLAEQASRTLMELGADNAAVVSGFLPDGYPGEGPYDVILLNGAVPEVPGRLMDQLKDGGRLAAIIAAHNFGQATLFRNSGGHVNHRPAFDAAGPALPGFELEKEFVF
ncbi:protein-L-isoaspartate O-methyltransferase [bacterium BMS3Bbin10]|nr:protein-L-isoaspartate O-methyltransferase [bacterium BMS3Bbin10]HDL17111.1 protein-L-isoaspartate O-methyltransferase [Hyphomicrobiales bacterium]